MKYIHIIPSLNPKLGGTVSAVAQLSGAAIDLGHQVEIVTLDTPDVEWATAYKAPVHFLGPARLKYRYATSLIPWIHNNARHYDAIIVDGLWQYHSYATWLALRHHATPYFVFPHGMLDPWFKSVHPLKHLKKWLYWPWAEYRVLRDATAVFFTTDEERLASRRTFSLYKANEVVVCLGIAAPTGDPAAKKEHFLSIVPHLRNKRIILFLARLDPKKGADMLIDAFAALPSRDPALHLVMAGPDDAGLQLTLERRARTLNIDHCITWTGMLTGDLKWGAFYAADAFALPSHQENFGVAVVEALACGLPVLISNRVNIWRDIARDKAGLVGPDTFEGTLDVLGQWTARTEAERNTFKTAARECFKLHFNITNAAHTLVSTMDNCINARTPK